MLRPKVGRLWANGSSVARRDPGDTKYVTGWLSEIPTYQVLNYLQWKTDSTFLALAERGVLEWGSDVTYKKGAAAWDETDGRVYVALLNNPDKTKAPSTNSAQWEGASIQLSRVAYDATVKLITDHVADVTGNPHKLTPGRLGAYTVAQTDALVAQYRAEVQTHARRTDNPHSVTATDIGAVPVTGGNYTGDVTMDTGQILLSNDGKRLIKADSSGVYLKNEAGQIGVDDTGKGFVRIGAGASSEIITKLTFADNKKATEPKYAVPQPSFYMPLIGDQNIYLGVGTTESKYSNNASWEPAYSDGLLVGGIAALDQTITFTATPLEGTANATSAIDVWLPSVVENLTASELIWSTGSTDKCLLIEVRKDNSVRCRNAVNTDSIVLSSGAWHRVVAVMYADRIQLYVDGVQVNSTTTTNAAVSGSAMNYLRSMAQPSAQRQIKVRNARMWAVALTANQVSVL